MSHFKKCRVALWMIFLTGIVAAPLCHAQTNSQIQIFPLNSSGSYLGISMDDVTAANMSNYKLSAERGVIVRSVSKGSPAEVANLKENDVVLEYGGFPVWSSTQLRRLVEDTPAGRKVDLVVSRDGRRINLSVTIESREGKRLENEYTIPNLREFFGQAPRSFQFPWPNTPGNGDSGEPTAQKPRLGVNLQPLTDQLGEYLGVPKKKGALVVSVADGSAGSGKIKAGDVIVGADGRTIDNPDDLIQFISNAEGAVSLRIIRDKREITVVVNLPSDDNKKGYKF
jgi:serine protease Do